MNEAERARTVVMPVCSLVDISPERRHPALTWRRALWIALEDQHPSTWGRDGAQVSAEIRLSGRDANNETNNQNPQKKTKKAVAKKQRHHKRNRWDWTGGAESGPPRMSNPARYTTPYGEGRGDGARPGQVSYYW